MWRFGEWRWLVAKVHSSSGVRTTPEPRQDQGRVLTEGENLGVMSVGSHAFDERVLWLKLDADDQ